MLACKNRHLKVAEFLLEQGADKSVINKVSWHTLFINQRYINVLAKDITSTWLSIAIIEFIIKWKDVSQITKLIH